MQLGAVFPQSEIDQDPDSITRFARIAEYTGYDTLLAYDHVLGANPDDPDFDGPYDNDDVFHEPLTLFSYLAGVTDTINLASSVLILPQRQTALVAKQAAEADVLSGGRVRLGLGIGWNDREYEALGMDFGSRGPRVEEQVEVLRRLWTEETVEFDGRWHSLPDVGINPRPVQRSIPIWMGGDAPPVLRRIGSMADGWLTRGTSPTTSLNQIEEQIQTIREHARKNDRDPEDIDIIPRIQPTGETSEWVEHAKAWLDLGATYLTVDTVGMDLPLDAHIEKVTDFYSAMDDL